MSMDEHPRIPNDLIEAVKSGECVLFLGAGISMEAGLPSGRELAKRLAQEIRYPRLDDPLAKVAQVYERDRGRNALLRFLRREITGKSKGPGQLPYGGIETYVGGIRQYSGHIHVTRPILVAAESIPPGVSYPTDYSLFRYASIASINELKAANERYEKVGRTMSKTVSFIDGLELNRGERNVFERIKREVEEVVGTLGGFGIVHAHFFLPAYLAQNSDLKTIFTSHSLLSKDLLLEGNEIDAEQCGKDERDYYQEIEHVIALSEAHKREAESVGASAPILMQPIFDISEFDSPEVRGISSSEARRRLGIPDKLTVLFLGRPTYRKGLEVLIDAFGQINREDVQLVIVGKGFKYDPSRCIIGYESGGQPREIQVKKDCVERILPPVEEESREAIALHYKAADIVVCPSLYEPFGYVNLEAMAAGRPVIASNVDGIPEIVQHKYTGLLFEPGNAAELRDKILLLLEDENLRLRLGRNAYEFIRGNFDSERAAKELDRLYEQVAEEHYEREATEV
jgi:glycosyltransferase involved in cell wall biosynthesis